ncbi:Fc.00g107270.m01.CDS01 [Cosmosporella sp. VM-42]
MVNEADDGLGDVPDGGWQAARGWRMPDEVEPVLIVSILLTAMWFTRRKNYSILKRSTDRYEPLLDQDASPQSSNEFRHAPRRNPHPPKVRILCGLRRIETPNSSRFARHYHSRILQKFPFLIEMFYWGISFGAYRLTNVLAAAYYGGRRSMWDSAQEHGMNILNFEANFWGGDHEGPARWIEWRIERWFLHGAEAGDYRGWWLTVLNRGYALIHIPGTVGFIAYYYATAPTHARFCAVRRTMTVTNFLAFAVFILVPVMPPRLLPEKYGFVDTVNLEKAESVWMSGDFVNKLAAMPSMHFGYAFCIGCVFVVDSGVLRGLFPWARGMLIRGNDLERLVDDQGNDEKLLADRGTFARVALLAFGVWYPSWILLTIVATANHYFLDAFAAAFVVMLGYLCNRILLVFFPLEDWLLWALRLEKPIPTTGWKKNLAVD